MEKAKLLTYTVIALLLLNLGTLTYLFNAQDKGPRPPHGRPHGKPMPREIIIEKLRLDDQQVQQYDVLIEWHHEQISRTEEKIRENKNLLYQLLNDPNAENQAKKRLIDSLALYQSEIEAIHFKHFGDIRKLCKKEQLKDYEALTAELSNLFSKPPRPRHD